MNRLEQIQARLEQAEAGRDVSSGFYDHARADMRLLLDGLKSAITAIGALSQLAWVSYEGDPWYAEHEKLDVAAVRDAEDRFKKVVLPLLGNEQ